jgi:uncharacterized membrane protein
MRSLTLAVAYFLGIHFFISGTRLRGAIVARTGEPGFLTLFSVLSVVGMGWMIWAYSGADLVPIWTPNPLFHWLAIPLTLIAFLFIFAGLTTPSPTVVGGESAFSAADPASGMLRITRHPFLWGVALWAFTHLLVNGDLASIVLFGGMLILALIGPALIDAKCRARFGEKWKPFEAKTSNLPFAAVAQGRNHLSIAEIGWTRIAIAFAAWAAMIFLHPLLFGERALPM